MRIPLVLCALGFAGCPLPDPGPVDAGTDAGVVGHRAPEALQTCGASPAAVASIAQAVARFNALPAPVDGACFVASLARPIAITGSSSNLSLQPAVSPQTPRIFLINSSLVISVVPEGDGGHVVELGEWDTPLRTLKGELALPVTAPLGADAPFTRVKVNANGSTCGVCHRQESQSLNVPNAFVSAAFRPAPGDLVKLPALAAEHDGCVDAGTVSERCNMFHALFDFGEVRQGAFASSVELFIP